LKLTGQDIRHLSSVAHDGKVVVFGTATDGKIYYTVKRSGFEPSALQSGADPFGFEGWQLLPLGESKDDESVREHERKKLTDREGRPILRSLYGDGDEVTKSADGPVYPISAMEHLWVFRRSYTSNKILVGRFVLDGDLNVLAPKLEVRFVRSRQRLSAHQPKNVEAGLAATFDTLDYRDIDGVHFFEPAVELSFIGAAKGLAPVFVPTMESDRFRWHLFVRDPQDRLVLYTIGGGGNGMFDPKDYLFSRLDPEAPENAVHRSIAGIIQRVIALKSKTDVPGTETALTVTGDPAATTYDVQREQMTDAGPQLIAGEIRVMLAVPVRGGTAAPSTAALDFAIATDGTLSEVEEEPDTTTLLRNDELEVQTSLSLFDNIKEIASSGTQEGVIAATERGDEDALKVRWTEAPATSVAVGSRVRLRGTQSYDGHYVVNRVHGDGFEVKATFSNNQAGFWEVVRQAETGLVFDNMIVGAEKIQQPVADGGTLKILCPAHDLEVGNEVQISGTREYNGIYPIVSVNDSNDGFTLDTTYFTGEAANLKKVVRRGMRMGDDGLVTVPDLSIPAPSASSNVGRTISAWVRTDAASATTQVLVQDAQGMALVLGGDNKVRFDVVTSDGGVYSVADPAVLSTGKWTHYAGTADFQVSQGKTRLCLLRDGEKAAEFTVGQRPALAPPVSWPRTVFHGAGDRVDVDGVGADMTRPFTISFRANVIGSIGSKRTAIVCSNSDYSGFEIYHNSSWFAKFKYAGNAPIHKLADVVPGRAIWISISFTNSDTLKIYIDGVEKLTTINYYAKPAETNVPLRIGGPTSGASFMGELTNVTLWKRALLANEVAGLVDGSWTGAESDLIGHWPLQGDAKDRSPRGRHGKLQGAPTFEDTDRPKTGFIIGHDFQGEIADAQLWSIARPPADVKATMHLQLTGMERGLVANYRLGAFVHDGDRVTVPDFSQYNRDGLVSGDAYAGARRLQRKTGSGMKVEKYASDELVAVSQRGTYEETFEFKVHASDPQFDPHDVDGTGNKLFVFSHWGKWSHGSDEKIRFSGVDSKFESIGGGWYRARCRVVVPDGVGLMRAFEIAEVKGRWGVEEEPPEGEWTAIDIRKHHIRLVSDSITCQGFAEVVTLLPSPMQNNAANDELNKMASAEAEVAGRELEVADLLLRIDVVDNSIAYEQERTALADYITALNAQIAATTKEIWGIENDPFSYWQAIKAKHSNMYVTHNKNDDTIFQWNGSDGKPCSDQLWAFVKEKDGSFTIRHRDLSANMALSGPNAIIRGVSDRTASAGWWLSVDGAYHLLYNKAQNQYADVWGYSYSEGTHLVGYGSSGKENQRFMLQKQAGMTTEASEKYKSEQTELVRQQDELKAASARKAELDQLLNNKEDRAKLIAAYDAASAGLDAARTSVATHNTAFLSSLQQAAPAKMPVLATDTRRLPTKGSLLDFVQADGGLGLLTSGDGNLLLTCFDTQGRIRTTAYDPIADSQNASFEQWRPDALRACADLRDAGDKITISSPPALPAEAWTCEAWVQYPFATRKETNTNGSTGNGNPLDMNVIVAMGGATPDLLMDAPLAVRNGTRLGLVAGGWFFDSGVDLGRRLCADWHHLAVTWSAAVARFYADGVLLARIPASQAALRFSGSKECVTVPAHTGPTQRFSVSTWARSPTATWSGTGCLVHKEGVFKLSPEGDKKIAFSVWVGGSTFTEKKVLYTLPASFDIRVWHLYTGTFDGNYISLYADGKLLGTRVQAAGAMNGGSKSVCIASDKGEASSAYLRVDITEVCCWSKALGPDSMRDLWNGKVLTGAEEGLTHLWRLQPVDDGSGGRKIPDLCAAQKCEGTVVGSPQNLLMTPFSSASVRYLGNAPTGGSPIGRLAEVRLWDVALSDTEVAANARLSLSGNEPRLLAWWPLDEATADAKARDACWSGLAHGQRVGVDQVGCTAAVGNPGSAVLSLPEPAKSCVKCPSLVLAGKSFSIELWSRRRTPRGTQYVLTMGTGAPRKGLNFGYYSSDNSFGFGFWDDDCRSGTVETDTAWHHWCGTFDADSKSQKLYRDGVLLRTRVADGHLQQQSGDLFIGSAFGETQFLHGDVAEVRVWSRVRTEAEINNTMRRRLTGKEEGLLACYPLDEVDVQGAFLNRVSGKYDGAPCGASRLAVSTTLRIAGAERLMGCEYATTQSDRDGQKHSMLRRFFGWCLGGDAELLSEQRVEALTLQWIGNTQIEPTLIGYIEGAPPVPSENLTEDEDGYKGATTVTLSQSEEVSYAFGRTESYAAVMEGSYFIGAAWETSGEAFGIAQKLSEGEVGGTAQNSRKDLWGRGTTVAATSSLQTSDSLSLSGMFEDKPMSRTLGTRWVPKNVGYALVLSGSADVFVTRLRRSGRMISYQIIPIEGVPLDVNTITFMMNPAYCLNGSLDGLVGSMAADPVFYGHVAEMRAQYGSAYPASYFRVKQADELKQTIDRQDKERQAFFENYQTMTLGRNEGVEPSDLSAFAPPEVDTEASEEEQQKAQQRQEEQMKLLQDDAEARMAEIDKMLATSEDQDRAHTAFVTWQRKMETLLVRAGKRNIVNTYVWDADGGLRAEEQSFASTIEHSINTDWSWSGGGGAEADVMLAGAKAKTSVVGYAESEGTTGKTQSISRALGLAIDLSGVEGEGVTDLRDTPRKPGEKVGRYRFSSFYLEGSTSHFNDLFRDVVDPEWLQSNSEEARAMRQAMAKPTRSWRVLHRVTYVERPALKNFGK
jgi:hypothetical protein